MNPIEDRLVELETRLSFQDQTQVQFNDALLAQQACLERQQRRIERLESELSRLLALLEQDPASEPPPPHY